MKRLLLLRGDDLLAQSSTQTLLDMLKSHAGIKECSDETAGHIKAVGCVLTDLFLFSGGREELAELIGFMATRKSGGISSRPLESYNKMAGAISVE